MAMEQSSVDFGKMGEDKAAQFYRNNHFEILETNWHFGHLEVDVIAADADTIVFCEVKTRSASYMGRPENFVTKQKQRNIIMAANTYVSRHKIARNVRFDVIAIVKKGTFFELKHIPNAFSPKW